ncbi:class I mannose-6-phosphate isomerase [Cellulomonas sp. KRMCY2]|uniref:class I mannose-6-phosphate isomerase n=1 Tax=Cellulomonas sp. KRMCY2 TaxID=1304865 RepID=UPI0004BADC0A|nr:class I mannose-6-phosphate isomerase [Cellulomonas sp. KRMCY2]
MDRSLQEGILGARAVALTANAPPTFYRGAGRIALFRGGTPDVDERPEDWVASTVTRLGEETAGLTTLVTGRFLRDAVRADPAYWLGPIDRPTPELAVPLVKLLDAGQRLPIHVHPDDAYARTLGVWPQGKAEAWFVIEAPTSGVVHLGWTRAVGDDELTRWVDEQDVAAMLGAMHALDVAAGDSVYVPPGTVHAIGQDIFLVEVQQAADLSVLLEWTGFFADSSGAFLGVERAAALGCVDLHGMSRTDAEALVRRGALESPVGADLLPEESREYFSATVLGAGSTLPAEYRTLVVIAGTGVLVPATSRHSPVVAVGRGGTFAVPAAAGPLVLEGSDDLRVLAFGAGRVEPGAAQ